MNRYKSILLVEDNAEDIELALAAISLHSLAAVTWKHEKGKVNQKGFLRGQRREEKFP